ncbi:MAG: hypothetical protein ACYC69_16480 [Thermodesulfovibrionales bacterium]
MKKKKEKILVKTALDTVDVYDSQIVLLDTVKIEIDPLHPYFGSPVTEEKKEPLKELIKYQTSADSILVYKTIEDGKERFWALDHIEFVQVAFLEFADKLWCQVISGITKAEAYLLMARLQGKNEHWTTFDQAVHYNNGHDLLGNDIEGAMARYAREAGCSRANVTHLYQIGVVAKFLKSQISPDKYNLLRTRGTHLRYMYAAQQSQWVKLCIDMLAGEWSAAKVEQAVKDLSPKSKTPDASVGSTPSETAANYTPSAEGGSGDEAVAAPTSPFQPLNGAVSKIIYLQQELIEAASNIEQGWESLTTENQDAVYAFGTTIRRDITNILSMFNPGGMLACLVPSNTEAVEPPPVAETEDPELAEALSNAKQADLITTGEEK